MIIVAKIIVSDQGRINSFLGGIDDDDIITIAPHGDGKILVAYKGESDFMQGEVIIKEVVKEVEVIKKIEVIKEVPFDNPELLEQIQTLQDALTDALNAEEKAKKEAEELKKQIPKLKTQLTKLKKALAED